MDPLSEAFQHHTWATEQLIRHLRQLPAESLSSTSTGVYGEVLATLSHLLAADSRYLAYLEGVPLPSRAGPDETRSLDDLADALRDQAVRWRILLARLDELDVLQVAIEGQSEIGGVAQAAAVLQRVRYVLLDLLVPCFVGGSSGCLMRFVEFSQHPPGLAIDLKRIGLAA